MKQILAIIKKQTVVTVFFLFLIVSLFLGDGKQPQVDVFWALGVLMLYAVHYYQEGKLVLRALPRSITVTWAALILYYIVRTLFSDSVGFSVTATVRILEAYLLYILFYTISSERMVGFFEKCLIVVGAVAIIASWVFIAFPSLAGFLPLMNLLYASYGHNHLADLLLPIFPLIIAQIQYKPSKLSWFLLLFYTAGMILTFARGAWIVLIGYFIYVFLYSRGEIFTRYKRAILIVLFSFVCLFIGTSLYSRQFSDATKPTNWLMRQLIKPSFADDGRLKYWKQAVLAIRERPWFGGGPGTFYLQSKRLQEAPASFSWFAHSFPLQSFVELGILGALPLFVLISLHIHEAVKIIHERATRVNESRGFVLSLAWGVLLSFLYSFYEFNLDYLVLWLLFWVACGLVIGYKEKASS